MTLSRYLQTEIDTIYNSFINLAYPRNFIDCTLRDVRQKFYRPRARAEIDEVDRKPIISLPVNSYIDKFAKPVI